MTFSYSDDRRNPQRLPAANAAARRGDTLFQQSASWMAQAAILLLFAAFPGCGSPSAGKPEGLGGSVFQSTRYPVTAVLVEKDQKPVYLEALTINAAPSAEVRKRFDAVLTTFKSESNEIEGRITQCTDQIKAQESVKSEKCREISEEAERKLPQASDLTTNSRNPLKSLAKARATKNTADDWVKDQLSQHVEPVEARIRELEQQRRSLLDRLASKRASLLDQLFTSLPSPVKSWKTGKNGSVTVDIPNDGPWTVWSAATHRFSTGKIRERRGTTGPSTGGTGFTVTEIEKDTTAEKTVRWILEVPKDLDDNKSLSLDMTTALEMRAAPLVSLGIDGQYFRQDATN